MCAVKSGRRDCVFNSRGDRVKGRVGKQALQKRYYFCCHCGAGRGREAGPWGQISPWAANHIPHPGLYPADILGHYGHEAMIGEQVPFTPAPLIRGTVGTVQPRRTVFRNSAGPLLHLGGVGGRRTAQPWRWGDEVGKRTTANPVMDHGQIHLRRWRRRWCSDSACS